ncbi:LysR family transcriptional regulator [Nitrosovibrio tenuis]|uniref:DNA-binding transcriptional regulator, LysR family n=1 Tax=Nitrosovibrio tenuis TaxID=1233 RepID=A0A1H7PFH1_9PROT|nr:LysR family transcriptional regulator [Nitrosovibrio tenuis]SEL34174.1 DNA-binding transcriptional regulator, LysR family [Nitrosovibrio tenuis]
MLDAMSTDQLRTFIAAADEGSFSAAGRKLRRAQSVVSQTLANLELQVGFTLFDRSGRYPKLTEAGRALLADARVVISSMDAFKAKARTLEEGLEPELAVAVDVMYPIAALTEAVRAFHEAFPAMPLHLYVEALGAVMQPVLDGRCRIGIAGQVPEVPADCASEYLLSVHMVTVAAPSHPLAKQAGTVTRADAANHMQLVLTDRSTLTEGRTFGVLASQTWRLADLGAKHAFLRAGLGWGNMPLPMVEEDLSRGTLIRIELEPYSVTGAWLSMYAIHRKDAPPGPAGRWFMEKLKQR